MSLHININTTVVFDIKQIERQGIRASVKDVAEDVVIVSQNQKREGIYLQFTTYKYQLTPYTRCT